MVNGFTQSLTPQKNLKDETILELFSVLSRERLLLYERGAVEVYFQNDTSAGWPGVKLGDAYIIELSRTNPRIKFSATNIMQETHVLTQVNLFFL